MTRRTFLLGGLMLLSFARGGWAQPSGSSEERRRLRRSPVVQVFEQNKDAVVNISTTQVIQVRSPFAFDSMFDELFDFPADPGETRQYTTTAVGSGFVIHRAGYIVTNAHVVTRTAERKVIFPDHRAFDAEIVATDPRRDLAVLKIESDRPLIPVTLGRSDDLMVGETVIAIGNPVGLETTVTAGVVSALNRQLEVKGKVALDGLIQTDASINPGNSGGPLLNVLGELIGITTAIRGDAQNIGFAIPVDKLVESLPELLSVERRYRIIIGFDVNPFGEAWIENVRPGSPAGEAGLRAGDVIRRIDDQEIHSGIDVPISLLGRQAGETITLEIVRDGRRFAVPLTIRAMAKPDGSQLALVKLGLSLEPLTAAMAGKMGLGATRGLLVQKIDPTGPSAKLGIEPGDIVVEIGPYAPDSLDDLGLLLETVEPGSNVPVGILRIGKRLLYRLKTEITTR